jgi:hypothetical protein
MSSPLRVNMIIFLETDIQAALEFYLKLGLVEVFNIPNRWVELQLGDVKIGLCPTSSPVQTIRSTGVVFEIDDVKAFYEKHKTEFDFLGEPKEALHGIMVSIKDPGGNIIDLYQPTPERIKEVLSQDISELKGQGCNDRKSQFCCKDDDSNDECCKPKKGCC